MHDACSDFMEQTLQLYQNTFMATISMFTVTAEEAILRGHFEKLKFFDCKIEFLWRALKFKRGHNPSGPPFSTAYEPVAIKVS